MDEIEYTSIEQSLSLEDYCERFLKLNEREAVNLLLFTAYQITNNNKIYREMCECIADVMGEREEDD